MESEGLEALGQVEVSLGTDATRSGGVAGPVRNALKKLGETMPVESVDAVGHRVVHGGTRFREAVKVTPTVVTSIEQLSEFAPLHNPVAAAVIRAAQPALNASRTWQLSTPLFTPVLRSGLRVSGTRTLVFGLEDPSLRVPRPLG